MLQYHHSSIGRIPNSIDISKSSRSPQPPSQISSQLLALSNPFQSAFQLRSIYNLSLSLSFHKDECLFKEYFRLMRSLRLFRI